MADVRISSQNILPVRTQPVAKAEAVRAAQRAFFDAAMNAANATAPAKAPQTTVASVSAPARASAPPVSSSDTPQRYARPGSVLDIKV